ncbi:MAG: lysophospholipid acyltransferase family protein [Methylacidiphilales bacterium]|nr:lysophospholipid acyltransferase family protein [Candidatus Methylacidiphilales bacterium]
MKSALGRKWIRRFGPPLIAAIIKVLGASLRVTVEDIPGVRSNKEQREPFLFAFWHNRIFLMPYFYRKYMGGRNLTVMASPSRDGQLSTDMAKYFGIHAARGSSSRSGLRAQIQLVRELKSAGSDVAVTPDGPRGPCYTVKHGILQLAQSSGLSILPVTYHLSAKWEMSSWDGFQIPKPFARCHIRVGEPLHVGADDDFVKMAEELARRMGE